MSGKHISQTFFFSYHPNQMQMLNKAPFYYLTQQVHIFRHCVRNHQNKTPTHWQAHRKVATQTHPVWKKPLWQFVVEHCWHFCLLCRPADYNYRWRHFSCYLRVAYAQRQQQWLRHTESERCLLRPSVSCSFLQLNSDGNVKDWTTLAT